jgi:hypothetical protein
MRYFRLLLFAMFAMSASAQTTRYLDASASGANNGTSWADAWQTATAAESGAARNTLIYVADGSYTASLTCNTALNGTQTIEFRKATSGDHGSDTGWSAGMGDGQATFGSVNLVTGYWIFNGVTRTETTRMEAPAGYGFKVDNFNADSLSGDDASFSQIKYCDVGGTWSTETSPTCANTDGYAIRFVYNQNNITFTRCIFHNRGSGNSALAMMHGSDDITFDHCDFYQGWGKATVATPNTGQDNHTVKYCRFWNSSRSEGAGCGGSGVGITTELGTYSFAGTTTGHLVYGCIFYGTASGGRNAVIQYGESSPGPTASNCKIFNNTFAGFPEDPVVAHIYLYSGSGNEARNNLFYDVAGSMEITANTTSNNIDESSDPFVNYAALDFRLAVPTTAGFDTGSPYNVDPAAETRGADGTWDVGAYEYVAAGTPQSSAPIARGLRGIRLRSR